MRHSQLVDDMVKLHLSKVKDSAAALQFQLARGMKVCVLNKLAEEVVQSKQKGFIPESVSDREVEEMLGCTLGIDNMLVKAKRVEDESKSDEGSEGMAED